MTLTLYRSFCHHIYDIYDRSLLNFRLAICLKPEVLCG